MLAREALTRRGTTALVLTGEAGVGKTRLAREIALRAVDRGAHVLRAVATVQTRQVPLGAIAHLLAGHEHPRELRDSFTAPAHARRSLSAGVDLVVIDDAAHLDDLSVGIVQQLVREGSESPRLVLTARNEEIPVWLADLARDDHVAHVRLQPLSEKDVDEVLDAALPGEIDEQTRAMFWTHSRGNALLLRLLTSDGLHRGALTMTDGVWRWLGDLDSADLWSAIRARLDWMAADAREVVELIAVGEPVPPAIIEDLGGANHLPSLETHGLIELDERQRIRITHPLIAAVLRDRLTPLSARTFKSELAAAFIRTGYDDRADLLRVAEWYLAAGGNGHPELLVAAAHQALLLDPALAEAFARAAHDEGAIRETNSLLARAQFEQGRIDEAMASMADVVDAWPEQASDDEYATARLLLAMMSLGHRGDLDTALAMLDELDRTLPAAASRAAGIRAAVWLFAGSPARCLEAAAGTTHDRSANRALDLMAAIAEVLALALVGHVREAIARAEGVGVKDAVLDADLITPDYGPIYAWAQLHWEYVFALCWAGRADEAIALSRARLDDDSADTLRPPYSRALVQAACGNALLATGQVDEASATLRAAAETLRVWDQNGILSSCLADLARAEALRGDLSAAEAAIEEADRRCPPGIHLFDAALLHARAVVTAANGDLPGARETARAGARTAQERGQIVIEAACLHLLVRFGTPEEASDRLAELANSCDSPLARAFADHGAAALASDTAELEEAAGSLADAGARLLASHAAAEASQVATSPADARRTAHLSATWASRCPGAPRPTAKVTPRALTTRERDVATMAASGMSNQQIADELVISIRTVESHLEHIYRKLGVSGREELPAMALW